MAGAQSLSPSARTLAAPASHAAVIAARAPAEAISAASADAGTATINARTVEVAAAPMPMTPAAPFAADILNRITLCGLGLDRLAGSAWEGGSRRKVRRYGCAGRDRRGEGKSFQSHVSLLDIDWPGMWSEGVAPLGGGARKHIKSEPPMNCSMSEYFSENGRSRQKRDSRYALFA